jgi:hypothetical protein
LSGAIIQEAKTRYARNEVGSASTTIALVRTDIGCC